MDGALLLNPLTMKNIARLVLVAGAFAAVGFLPSCAHQTPIASNDTVKLASNLAPTLADREREQRDDDRLYQERVLKELSAYKPKS